MSDSNATEPETVGWYVYTGDDTSLFFADEEPDAQAWAEKHGVEYHALIKYQDFHNLRTSLEPSRIRAETAKNSGEPQPYAWEWSQLMHDSMGGWEQKMTRSGPPSYVRKEDIRDLKPLFLATPANSRAKAIGAAIRIKPPEWRDVSSDGVLCFVGHTLVGRFAYGVDLDNKAYWQSPNGEFEADTIEAAKAAAQADYEQRIRSALLQQEGE